MLEPSDIYPNTGKMYYNKKDKIERVIHIGKKDVKPFSIHEDREKVDKLIIKTADLTVKQYTDIKFMKDLFFHKCISPYQIYGRTNSLNVIIITD